MIMVGLGDIPCVGTFVERISNKTADAVFRGFRYVFRYKALVDQLTAETAKLNIQKEEMSIKVKKEKDNGKEIKEHVLKWQKDVEEEIEKSAEELSPSCRCIQRLPISNPVSRFRIGRNAAKKATNVIELTATGKDHNTKEIAYPLQVINMPKSDTAFEEFESRKEVYKKLWDALVNKDSPLIHGIYGMAGVGKTRMMEQLWEDAMKKQIFKKVVRVNVGSENLDEYELQDQIAGRLNCHLDSQDVESRAAQLEKSFINGGKILLILDDLWREIPLDNIIGIPFGDHSSSKGSKILLTSRQKRVCEVNNCEHPVEVKTLNSVEALDLFMKTVGPDTNSLPDQSLVKEVCDECGQLPLLILAVGKALKRKGQNSWAYALNQLQKGKFENIPGVDRRVYAGIKLSIDFLEHDDAKSCLFLCCLFPEDANIDMKMLIQLATGSQLIGDGESSVLAMVDSLKDSSLLVDSGRYNKTKVHDIIRDVARNLASTDSKYAFLHVKCNSRHFPSDDVGYCTRKLLRLDVETDDVHFEEHPVFPDLHTLWLQCNNHPQQFSYGFFQMFVNLGCLMLQNVHKSLEKFSLQRLGKLGTLSLIRCDISNTDVSLFPKKLKTLYICDCDLPSPLDIANLKYLRNLEIQKGSKFVMGSNVISSLSGLEELHIPNGYIIDLEEDEIDRIVTEISELTYLKSLQFHFYGVDTFQGRNVIPDIDRYKVCVRVPDKVHYWRNYWERDGIVPSTKSIVLYGNHSQSWEGLMARAEQVILGNSDVEVSSICNGHSGAFEHLERLYISRCNKMGHLARFSHSLQHGATCFSKITILEIEKCSELKYLFCNKIAKSLAQLQELSVRSCKSMEAIIMNEGTTDGEIIIFPRLKSLKMDNVPRLASFYAEKKIMHRGSTVPMENSAQLQPFLDGMVAFPFLEKMYIKKYDNMRQLASTSQDEIQYSLQHGARCFSKLTILQIKSCSKLKYLFCNKIAKSLVQLQELMVSHCESMEAIIMNEGTSVGEIIKFTKLKSLEIDNVPRLASFYAEKKNMHRGSTLSVDNSAQHQSFFDGMVAFPFLEKMYITKCDNMRQLASTSQDEIQYSLQHGATLFSKLTILEISFCSKLKYLFCNIIAKSLSQLQELNVESCEYMEAIIMNEATTDGEIPPYVSHSLQHGASCFSKLTILKIKNCSELKYLFCNKIAKSLAQLQELMVSHCESMVAIIMNEGTSVGEIIKFTKLKSLEIDNVPRLASFYAEKKILDPGSTLLLENFAEHQPFFDGMAAFPCLETLEIYGLPNTSVIWGKDCFNNDNVSSFCKLTYIDLCRCNELEIAIPQAMLHRLNNLEYVKVGTCNSLRSMFPSSVASDLTHLKKLRVYSCEEMREIIEAGESAITDNGLLFPEMTDLSLWGLPSLTSFWCYESEKANNCTVPLTLPQLSSIYLEDLPQLKRLFHGANFEFHVPALKQKQVIVSDCALLEGLTKLLN